MNRRYLKYYKSYVRYRRTHKQQKKPHQYRPEHAKEHRRYCRKNRYIAELIIGDSCIVCDKSENLEFHELEGKKHTTGQNSKYYLEHPSDFIPLCHSHHKFVEYSTVIKS